MKLFNETSKTFEKYLRVFLLVGFVTNITVVVLLFLGILKPPHALTHTEPYTPAGMDDNQAKMEIPLRVSAIPRVNEDK